MVSTASNRFGAGTSSSSGLARSTAAGAVAALVGAILWTVVVSVSGYELGIAAVVIGFLVGQAMAATAGTSKQLPVIGAGLSLIGCLLGNIFTDAHYFGQAAGWSIPHVLGRMISEPSLGKSIFSAGFSGIDVLFWAIACYEGYKLTARGVARRMAGSSLPHAPAGPVQPTYPMPAASPLTHPADFFTPTEPGNQPPSFTEPTPHTPHVEHPTHPHTDHPPSPPPHTGH